MRRRERPARSRGASATGVEPRLDASTVSHAKRGKYSSIAWRRRDSLDRIATGTRCRPECGFSVVLELDPRDAFDERVDFGRREVRDNGADPLADPLAKDRENLLRVCRRL